MKILRYIGYRNWAIIDYNSCTENIFVIFYIALVTQNYGWDFVITFFLFYLLSFLSISYGYLTNDLSDVTLDRLHKKQNVFQNDSKFKAKIVVIVYFLFANIAAYPFFGKNHFLIFWVLWLFAATFYSLRPLRFKERGKWGLFTVVAAQRVLPGLLILTAFDYPISLHASILIFYIANKGFISDIRHQMEDYTNDISTQTETFAVRAGIEKVEKVFLYLLNIDLFLFSLFMFVLFTRSPWLLIGKMRLPFFTVFLIAYVIILTVYLVKRLITNKIEAKSDPQYDKGYVNLLHIGIPSFYLPIWQLIFLCLAFPGNIIILLFFVLLITKCFSRDRIDSSLFMSAIRKVFRFSQR